MSSINLDFNLSAMADRLFAEQRLLPLAGKIRRVHELHSLTADLKMALDSLSILVSEILNRSEADSRQKTLEASLLNNAIVMYARATKTSSDERKGFDIRSKFSEEQLVVHAEICDLRDKAVAHFGSGGSYSGQWQDDVVVFHLRDDAASTSALTVRQTVDRELVGRAYCQVKIAFDIMNAAYVDKHEEMWMAFDKMVADDPINFIMTEVFRHPFDLDLFAKSSSFAADFRSVIDAKKRRGGIGW